jgi:hypothetical protein
MAKMRFGNHEVEVERVDGVLTCEHCQSRSKSAKSFIQRHVFGGATLKKPALSEQSHDLLLQVTSRLD